MCTNAARANPSLSSAYKGWSRNGNGKQGAARDCRQKFTARACKHRQVHFCVCHVLRPVSTFAREREQKKRKINWPVRLSNQAICYWSLHSHSLRKQLNSAPMPELIVHASPRKSNHWSLVVNRNRNFGRMVLVPALALVAHAGCAYALYTVPLCWKSLFTPSPRKSNHRSLDVNCNCGRGRTRTRNRNRSCDCNRNRSGDRSKSRW